MHMLKWSDEYAKNLMCRLFGHKWNEGWYGSQPYLKPKYYTTDNLGTEHMKLYCRCFRCNQEVSIGFMHKQSVDAEMERAYEKWPHIKRR